MLSKISRFYKYTESSKFRKFLQYFTIVTLVIYLFISISAFATWFPGSTSFFVFNSKSGLILRIFSSILFFFSCFLIYITYRDKINKKWFFAFILIILFNLIGILYTPTEYYTLYRTTQLYEFMGEFYISVSATDIFIMFLSFAVDILFGFCVMFILPKCLTKKALIIVCSLFLLIMLYSCFYSLIFENVYYRKFLSGDWSYTSETIGSIFGNKQQWGIFLIAAIPASSILIYLIIKSKINNIYKVFLCLLYALCLLLCFFCGVASFCKTAIVSYILFISIFLIGISTYLMVLKKRLISLLLIVVFCFLFVYCILVVNIPNLHQSGINKIIYNTITTLFSSGEGSIDIRFSLVNGFLQNYPGTNFFFGLSKGIVDPYVRYLMPELVVGLHTGIVVYFGRTGIIGLALYFLLLFMLIKKFVLIGKIDPVYCILLFCSLGCSLILDLSEAEILILSSSMNGFILNLLLVSYPTKAQEEMEAKKNEKISYLCI